MTAVKATARERLLAAANELFYDEGVQTVGIDRIIEQAGVAKASLYNSYGSKDELIRAYLTLRHEARRESTAQALALVDTPREKLLAIFEALERICERPGFHGCAFLNASVEARPGSAAEQAADDYRGWVRGLFTELSIEAGARSPEGLARQLHLLYDGAAISARMDRDPGAAASARLAAAVLIDSSLPLPA
jgi:AcrR family transcriptional regulator